ncbi:Archaeal fructose-1,6-bisphosphatase and related enzyme of inositol monophosphatase family [Candidatus Terasakiella magnetica]|nr:Archaeal fructose-1,6-bisphosphatase and related enzyme of inositol monophosphatase family [Candidatus Terasakiella magnetica]
MTARFDAAVVADIIRDAATSEVMPRFQNLSAGQIREKKPGQLVTEADVAAEQVLSRRLLDLVPGASVVGEEGVDAAPHLLHALDHPGTVWIIDPVDGTANFAKGNPRFGIIVALAVNGETVAGWIYDPVSQRMLIAEAGAGAWIGEERLSVLPPTPLERMTGSVKRTGRIASQVAKVGRKGSAAHDYIDLVTGKLHFAHYAQLMPWDHAAGVLIHAEAGGYSRLLTNQPYRPVTSESALLLAPSEGAWASLRFLID